MSNSTVIINDYSLPTPNTHERDDTDTHVKRKRLGFELVHSSVNKKRKRKKVLPKNNMHKIGRTDNGIFLEQILYYVFFSLKVQRFFVAGSHGYI